MRLVSPNDSWCMKHLTLKACGYLLWSGRASTSTNIEPLPKYVSTPNKFQIYENVSINFILKSKSNIISPTNTKMGK